MVNFCTNCGKQAIQGLDICPHCGYYYLKNHQKMIPPITTGRREFLKEKDLLEMCDLICELEFTYKDPKNTSYFDLFMLIKNLFDVISFYCYENGSISKIAEFYMFIWPYFQMITYINSERLRDRIMRILGIIGDNLKRENALESVDRVKCKRCLE